MEKQEIEAQLIGAWLSDQHLECIEQFACADFEIYPAEYKAISELYKTGRLDILNVAREAHATIAALSEIISFYYPALFDSAYRHLKENQIRLKLINLCKNPWDIESGINRIMSEIANLNLNCAEEIPKCGILSEYVQELQRRSEAEPLRWGLSSLDALTGGLRKQELLVIAARPSVGKTALALQTAYNLARAGKKVCFFSLEMARHQLTERLVCRLSDIQHEHLRQPHDLTQSEWHELGNIALPNDLLIYDETHTLSGFKKIIKRQHPDVVIIDQLSLIRPEFKFKDIRDRFIHNTNTLKSISMELDVCIILLAQVNRDAQNRLPTLANLKESSSIEEDSDLVIMLHKLSAEECSKTKTFNGQYDSLAEVGRVPIFLIVEKQRNGATGVLPYIFNPSKSMFEVVG